MKPINRLDEIVDKLSKSNLPDVDFEAYFKSHDEDKQNVKKLIDFYDDIENHIEHGAQIIGAKLPFTKTHEKFRFRDGEVTLWSGFNGHKKSMVAGYIALHLMKQQQKICIASFEMKPISTITRMVKQQSRTKDVSYSEYADFMSLYNDYFYLLDQQGGLSPERIYGVILYCAEELGVKHFFIDSLMRVIAGEDKYNEQKDFVVKLCDIALRTKTHIHLIHHTAKGKEDEPSGRYNAKGSGAISDNVHNSLIVWSNKAQDKDKPDMILKCDKQREGEWEGSLALKFESDSLCFYEYDYNHVD